MSIAQEISTKAPARQASAQQLKVLVLSPSLASAGGIQRYTATLVRALADELGEASVCCTAIAATGDEGQGRRLSALTKLGFAARALKQALAWKPDLVICTHLAIGPVGWLISRITRAPYWVVVYGIEAWGFLSSAKRHGLRRAERIILLSAFAGEQVHKLHGADSARMVVLPPCTVETLLRTDASSDVPIAEDEAAILMVARTAASEQYKGHDVVLRALPEVLRRQPKVKFVLVGDGNDRPRLEALAKELGVHERVWFAGEIKDDSLLAAIYRRSKVFVLPARTELDQRNPKGEGFGIVFLEAMSFGLPVIGPNDGAPREFIRDGENGLLVDPTSSQSVAAALLRLLTDPELAERMSNTGREFVATHYCYDRFRARLRELLEGEFSLERRPAVAYSVLECR